MSTRHRLATGMVFLALLTCWVCGCKREEPPVSSNDPYVTADATGDLFNNSGQSVEGGEAYLDITGTRVYRSGGHFTVRIELKGDLPASVVAGVFYEWDIFIDTDLQAKTGQHWALICNDIGYEFMARVGRDQNGYSQMLYCAATRSSTNINYKAAGRAIELYFAPALIGDVQSFDYVIASRKYPPGTSPDSPSVCDKAPNQGHGTVGP